MFEMAYVQSYFVTMVFVVGGFGAGKTEAISLSAENGAKLTIQCSHSNANGNTKYFCKDPCGDKNVLIRSNEKDPNGKYDMRDDGNTFYVTISDLTVEESGVYWCGVDRVGMDTYNKVVITVTPRTVEESLSNSSLQQASSTKKLLYIGSGLGALLMLLAIVVVIATKFRHRVFSKPTAGRKVNNVIYAKPFKSKQTSSQDRTISNQSSESDQQPIQQDGDRRLEATCDIYANINPKDSIIQSETVSYSSVCVNTSSVKNTLEHGLTVYSEVK